MGTNIISNLGALARAVVPFVIEALAVVIGLALLYSAVKAVYKMNDRGPSDPGAGTLTWGRVGGQALIGALLLQYARTMQDLSMLMFGEPIQDASAVMAYWGNGLTLCRLHSRGW